jgi:hypothetical protein
LTCKTDDQKTDLGILEGAVQKDESGKYLDFIIDVSKGSLLVAIFQAEWIRRLLLMSSMFLIPKPPLLVG